MVVLENLSYRSGINALLQSRDRVERPPIPSEGALRMDVDFGARQDVDRYSGLVVSAATRTGPSLRPDSVKGDGVSNCVHWEDLEPMYVTDPGEFFTVEIEIEDIASVGALDILIASGTRLGPTIGWGIYVQNSKPGMYVSTDGTNFGLGTSAVAMPAGGGTLTVMRTSTIAFFFYNGALLGAAGPLLAGDAFAANQIHLLSFPGGQFSSSVTINRIRMWEGFFLDLGQYSSRPIRANTGTI